MYLISPYLVVLLSALVGAAVMALLWGRARHPAAATAKRAPLPIAWGLLVGAGAGAAGALAAMTPLGFCTFATEPETTLDTAKVLEVIMGVGLIALVTGGLLFAATWVIDRRRRGERIVPVPTTYPGAFTGPWAGLSALVLLAPTLSVLAVFHYYPMGQTFRLATLLARLGAPRTRFVCLGNFTRLFTDPDYWYSVGLSFFLALAIILIGLSLSLLIAVMASQPIKGARVYRVLLVWPYALSPVIAGIIFQLMFNNTAGVLNYVLESTFGVTVPWLLNPRIAPWTIVLTSVWNIMGFNILFYIAGLQNISSDLLEAAAIDGANVFQRFFRVTFPLLSPITFFLIVTNTTYAFFDTFGLIDFLTGGGPVNSTSTLMYEVFVVGIENRDLGKAAAQSLVLFLIVIAITIFQFRFSRNRVTYGA